MVGGERSGDETGARYYRRRERERRGRGRGEETTGEEIDRLGAMRQDGAMRSTEAVKTRYMSWHDVSSCRIVSHCVVRMTAHPIAPHCYIISHPIPSHPIPFKSHPLHPPSLTNSPRSMRI